MEFRKLPGHFKSSEDMKAAFEDLRMPDDVTDKLQKYFLEYAGDTKIVAGVESVMRGALHIITESAQISDVKYMHYRLEEIPAYIEALVIEEHVEDALSFWLLPRT